MLLLDIQNLTVEFTLPTGKVKMLDRVTLKLHEGEMCGLVGESGSGKSLIARAILGLTNSTWKITADRFRFNNIELLKLSPAQRRKLVGQSIAIIFQDAKSSLDPFLTIGKQFRQNITSSGLTYRWPFKNRERQLRTIELLHRVGIKEHAEIMACYPHQLTEGECQKIVIAMALANKPQLLIADELTNTLASASQSLILRLLTSMSQNNNTAILMISHDLRMLNYWIDKIHVIYCGQLIEVGDIKEVLHHPQHPYTYSLIRSLKIPDKPKEKLYTLPGYSPSLENLPIGCRFGPRCSYAQRKCIEAPIMEQNKPHRVACHFPLTPLKE